MTAYNHATYTILEVDVKQNPLSKFQLKNETQSSYSEYMALKYNIKNINSNQPMIKAKSKKIRGKFTEVYLIPQLCNLTGLQEETRNNFQAMKQLGETTKPDPQTRL